MQSPVIKFTDKYRAVQINETVIDIYEPHGWFITPTTNKVCGGFDPNLIIIYGHEEIVVCDLNGNILSRHHTR
jgi:hypothetical protein